MAKKCLEKIHALQKKGTTIVLVSHDPNSVNTFCDRAIVLSKGKVFFDGPTSEALEKNNEIMDKRYIDSLSEEERSEILRIRALLKNDRLEGVTRLQKTKN